MQVEYLGIGVRYPAARLKKAPGADPEGHWRNMAEGQQVWEPRLRRPFGGYEDHRGAVETRFPDHLSQDGEGGKGIGDQAFPADR